VGTCAYELSGSSESSGQCRILSNSPR
jgi:hypothetical protein